MYQPHLCRVAIAAVLTSVPAASGQTPEPATTPTPRPTSLAAYARNTVLDRTDHSADGPIVITGDNLDELGHDAVFSIAGKPLAPPFEPDPNSRVDPKLRARWRSKVLAQSERIARLDARRAAVEAEIDRLERGRLDSRTLDRIERAEDKLRLVDADIKREKAALSRLVRDARRQGAQPGWFR
jgi:hypothetical protein